MDKEEATRICSQCHKEVAEANFALHETHCSRFLCVCPDCDETVPREQLNQHKDDEHTVVRCSKCNKKMERRFLLDHESDECVERLQSCQFCDLELPWKDLEKHAVACGSRTELCRDCKRYVKLSDMPQHGVTCSGTNGDLSSSQTAKASPTKLTVSCSSCMAQFPVDEIDKHKLGCNAASRQDYEEAQAEADEAEDHVFGQVPNAVLHNTLKATSLLNRPYSRPWGSGLDPNWISTCPHCHLALPIVTLRWHEVKCQRYILLK